MAISWQFVYICKTDHLHVKQVFPLYFLFGLKKLFRDKVASICSTNLGHSDPNKQGSGNDSPVGSRVGEAGKKLGSHSWKKGFPAVNRGPCRQRFRLGGMWKEGWKHLQPERGNQLLNLSEAVGHHGNSSRPWLALSNPAVLREELNCYVAHTSQTERHCEAGQKSCDYRCAGKCETQ